MADLHVILGGSAGGSLVRSGAVPRDEVLGFRDELSVGPLRSIGDRKEWVRRRAAFWSDVLRGTEDRQRFGEIDGEISEEFDRLEARMAAADRVTIWAATSVQEQVFLTFIVMFARSCGIGRERLRLRQFNGESRNIFGLGAFNSDMLSDHPADYEFSLPNWDEIDRAWQALTSERPNDILEIVNTEMSLGFLRRALRLLLWRYPNSVTGLDRIQTDVLTYCSETWQKSARPVGNALGRNETPDWVGDLTIFHALRRMARLDQPNPPLELRGDASAMRSCDVRITEFGRACLEGQANHALTNGVDDWVAGVHLNSEEGRVWLREDETLIQM